jgi:glycosyltransferase involved in cell wall biosynthesis
MERCVQEGVDVCIAVGISPNIVSCMIAGKIRTKFVICERNAPKQDAISIKSRIARFLLYRKADAFVFQTTGAQSFYSKSIQARSVVIPNPVIPGLPEWAPKGRNEIAAVGRLMPQKNYPLMLRSFALVHETHPDWSLRIFGEGIFHDDYQRLAESLGISDAVVFEGFRSDVHERIAECDIFLMTSDFEGMPNSLLEAMAIGMPCISTDCPAGGPAMLIEDGVNGLLCQVGEEDSIANAVNAAAGSKSLRTKLAKNALESRDLYSLDRIMMRWNSLIASLTN